MLWRSDLDRSATTTPLQQCFNNIFELQPGKQIENSVDYSICYRKQFLKLLSFLLYSLEMQNTVYYVLCSVHVL